MAAWTSPLADLRHARAQRDALALGVHLLQRREIAQRIVEPVRPDGGFGPAQQHRFADAVHVLAAHAFARLGHAGVEAVIRCSEQSQRELGFATLVVELGVLVALFFRLIECRDGFRMLVLALQCRTEVEARGTAQGTQCLGRGECPLRFGHGTAFQVVGPQVEEGAPAAYRACGSLEVGLLGSIGPGGVIVTQGRRSARRPAGRTPGPRSRPACRRRGA